MKKVIFIIPVLIVLLTVAFIGISTGKQNTTQFTARVEMTEINVSAKIPGRIDSLFVQEGQSITAGQELACLESNEINAKVKQAKGAVQAARAQYTKACNGARAQEILAAEKMVEQAQYQFDLAEQTFTRLEKIYQDSVISAQDFDQAAFKFKAARAQLEGARAKLEMAYEGARPEDKNAAHGMLMRAEGALMEAESYLNETRISSPVNGIVNETLINNGEMISPGFPVFTISQTDDVWLTMNVREDRLQGMTVGKICSVSIPALDNQSHEFKISKVAAMADFANWVAADQKDQFDLKTFQVQLRPVQPLNNVRAGMTAIVKVER